MNKTGLYVGVDCGQWVVISAEQEQDRFTNLIGSHDNTEYISVVEAISTDDVTIASLIIIKKAVIQVCWFLDIHDSDIAVDVSDLDYFNNLFSFQWLHHWNWLSKRMQQSTYHLLILNRYESHLSF